MSETETERRRRRAEEMRGAVERRAIDDTNLEARESNGTLTVTGYAATFNNTYDVGPYQERIAPTALDRCLSEQPDVVFNADHGASLSGLPLARTRSAKGGPGTLELSTDAHGLFFRALLDAADPDAQALARAIRNDVMRQCSFAFRTNRDTWNQDNTLRTLQDVSIHGGDVSCVAMPANPATSISVRHAADTTIVIPDYTSHARERVAQLRADAPMPVTCTPTTAVADPMAYYRRRLVELRG